MMRGPRLGEPAGWAERASAGDEAAGRNHRTGSRIWKESHRSFTHSDPTS